MYDRKVIFKHINFANNKNQKFGSFVQNLSYYILKDKTTPLCMYIHTDESSSA